MSKVEKKEETKAKVVKLVPEPGDKIKTVQGESHASNRTETVRGIHEGKKAKFSPVED